MYIQKSKKANTRSRKIKAEDEIMVEEKGAVEVAPEATELVFEAQDVAELVAEVTGENVEVEVSEDAVVFAVGEDEFTVEPEGDEEILESSRKKLRNKKVVKASRTPRRARRVRR